MLTENVKKLLKENMWDLATCSAGVPNVVPVAFKDVTDDGKTLEGCQIRGTAEHVADGPVVATFKAMVEQMFQGAATASFRARFCTLAFGARLRYAVGNKRRKGAIFMRIAVPYENGNIFQHFGRSEAFKFYDVADGAVTAADVVSTNGSGHGALAGFLVANHADVVICGGIGGGAQSALTEAGIRFYGGVSGSADAAVQALLDGSLGYDPEARCDHHDHAHGAGHTCGEHSCHN